MKISKQSQEKKTGRDAAIAELFCEYVRSMEDKPRHTAAAKTEADMYEQFCVSVFPNNVRLQIELYDKMMNVAVEFEESGFIAGFKTAMEILNNMALLRGREAAVWQA